VGFVIFECFENCVAVLVICVLVFIAFLYVSMCIFVLIFTIARNTATE